MQRKIITTITCLLWVIAKATDGYEVVTNVWGNNVEAEVTVEVATDIPQEQFLIILFEQLVTSLMVSIKPIYSNNIILLLLY